MARFTAKSVTVEAVQLTWGNWSEVCALLKSVPDGEAAVGVFVDRDVNIVQDGGARMGVRVQTPDGAWLAVEGDWIVLGPGGELSCCKPVLFAALFVEGVAAPAP